MELLNIYVKHENDDKIKASAAFLGWAFGSS